MSLSSQPKNNKLDHSLSFLFIYSNNQRGRSSLPTNSPRLEKLDLVKYSSEQI